MASLEAAVAVDDSDDDGGPSPPMNASPPLPRFGARTHLQLRIDDRRFAPAVVVLDACDVDWFNAEASAHVADLERAVAAAPALGRPAGTDAVPPCSVQGAHVSATVRLRPAPPPFQLLVPDEDGDGYRSLVYCGYEAECAVAPRRPDGPEDGMARADKNRPR